MTPQIPISIVLLVLIMAMPTEAEIPEAVLIAAGANREQIETSLKRVPEPQREGMEFLVLNMPARDLNSLAAEYLLENARLAYHSWQVDPWAKDVPKEIFFNSVLPYASINERRDNWRADFRNRFLPLVKKASTWRHGRRPMRGTYGTSLTLTRCSSD